jgi:predicted nucleic acid-binding protein
VLVLAWSRLSEECVQLLSRCKEEEVLGCVSTTTAAEVLHRVMCLELQKKRLDIKSPAKYLKKHPEAIRGLSDYWMFVKKLRSENLSILETEEKHIIDSQNLRDRYGLLTNDSIIAQVALDYGITAIATNDDDFERITEIQVYQLSDA